MVPHSENLSQSDKASCEVVRLLLHAEKLRSGMTQKTLATLIGKSTNTVSAIVTGQMKISVDVAISIASVFEVSPSEILPKLKSVKNPDKNTEIIDDLSELSPENRETIRRMIRRLLESQSDA